MCGLRAGVSEFIQPRIKIQNYKNFQAGAWGGRGSRRGGLE